MAPLGRLLAAALLLAPAARAAAPGPARPGAALVVENAERHRTFRLPLRRGQAFSVTSQHSIYDQPVTEDFVVDRRGRIVLEAVSSPSAAVREYFGLTSAGERHAVVRVLPEIVFRVAEGTAQRLRIGGVERSLLAFGRHGDRLVMRAGP